MRLYRAVDVAAPAEIVFRWLCQLRAAPYSYDLIDNGGRRSPQELTPGLERLEPGQRFMRIFRLVEFEPGRSITVLSRGTVFGEVAVTYRVRGAGAGRIAARGQAARHAGRRPVGQRSRAGAARRGRPRDDAPPAAEPRGARRARGAGSAGG